MTAEPFNPEVRASRVAIVTGGASGIGLAIARRLASDGNAVAVFDRNADGAAEAAASIEASGAKALGLGVDVTDRAGIEPASPRSTNAWGARPSS